MPLTSKGRKIMSAMKEQYGAKKGERVFYASRNAGKIKGVDPESKARGGRVDAHEAREKELIGEGGPVGLAKLAVTQFPGQPRPQDIAAGAGAIGEQNPTIQAMQRAHQERQRALGRAQGGSASGGPYIVGERGPEMFVPDSPGTIVPHHELARLARKYGGRVR